VKKQTNIPLRIQSVPNRWTCPRAHGLKQANHPRHPEREVRTAFRDG